MTLRIDIRDRRLRGGRLTISAGTKSTVVRRRRESAIRTLLDRGDVEVVERIRSGEVHISAIERAVREADFDSLRRESGTVLTLGALCERVFNIVDATRSKRSGKSYRTVATQLVDTFGTDKDIASITRDEVREFLYRQRNGGAWAPATQAHVVALAGRMWREAIEHEAAEAERMKTRPRVTRNPWREVETPEVRQTRVAFLRPAQWRKLAEVTQDRPEAALYALGCLAGLRAAEAMNLRTGIDVQLEQRRLHVQPREGAYPWRPKNDRSIRTLRICDELYEILSAHVDAGFAGDRYLVRTYRRDEPISQPTLQRWTAAAFAKAKLEYGRTGDGLTYHSLRHTFASWLVQRDIQLMKVAQLMGDTVAMVERVYGHLLPTDLDRAIDMVGFIAKEDE